MDNQICAKLVTEGNIALDTNMHKKQLERHIENDDYFGTLATVLNMARQTLEKDMRGPKKNWHIKLLQSLEEDLIYLQREYKITKK
ncbi:MAG: hypothetical protein NUV40_01650 [Patescibacteria group bacterium]|nr:hypothetical protein [Patescibacteria group bacterium]